MPANFDKAVANGGKVITKRLNAKEYMHIVYPKGGGAPIAGEVRQYKKILKSKPKDKRIFGKR